MKRIKLPLIKETICQLKAGDRCLLTGVLYTARDAAHKRLCEALERGEKMPIELKDATIYYTGPAPAKPGMAIGPCGPTTSYRMDAYAPTLIAQGLAGMIGKGRRNREVVEAMTGRAVYFGATGGCGALLAQCVRTCEVIAYPDLGAEAIHRLEVTDMPVTVIIDAFGNDLYEDGPAQYLETK